MKINEAKFIVRGFLAARKIPYTRITARTIGFADLARTSCIFVTIHGWKPAPIATELDEMAKVKGFCVDFDDD